MGSKAAVDRHLAVTRALICEVQTSSSSQDPEDGINSKTEDLLNGRRANTKVDTWDILWKTLFPLDEVSDIPHPGTSPIPVPPRARLTPLEFIPPIELEEVHSDFHHPPTLASLRTLLTTTPTLTPDALLPLITRHIDQVFSSCRHTKTGSSHPPRRRRQQRPKSTTNPTPTTSDTLTLRPVPFPYEDNGDSSPGSAISGGSWYPSQSHHPHLSPMASFLPHDMLAVGGRLTTSSSNASAILSPVMDDGLSPAAFGGESLSPSPAGFDGTPMFPALAAPGGPVGGGGYQFGGHHHRGAGGPTAGVYEGGGGGMGYGGGGGGGRMVPYEIATSMPMHPLPSQQGMAGEEMVPTTAIDRSGGFSFGGGHMGQGGGGGY